MLAKKFSHNHMQINGISVRRKKRLSSNSPSQARSALATTADYGRIVIACDNNFPPLVDTCWRREMTRGVTFAGEGEGRENKWYDASGGS